MVHRWTHNRAYNASGMPCLGGILACLIFTLSDGREAHADLLAYEGFEYDEIDGQLLGKNGGFGFRRPWEPSGGMGPTPLTITEGSFESEGLASSGDRLHVESTGGTNGLIRYLSSTIPANETDTMYMSFLIRPERGSSTTEDPRGWGSVGFIGVNNGNAPWAGYSGSEYFMKEFNGISSPVSAGVPAVLDEQALIVVRADMTPGQDTFRFYVNPSPGEPEPATGKDKFENMPGLGRIYIAAGSSSGFSVDEIRLGDDYFDVTGWGEPGSGQETISLSGFGETYAQDFDEALGIDGSAAGATFPTAWTHGIRDHETTTMFPVEETFAGNATFNAGKEADPDRALAIGVTGSSDQHYLQLHADVTEGDANLFQIQFDVEAWDARDGTFIPELNRIIGGPDDPGEAAFHVTVDVDMGDGFSPLLDLGTVTTGPVLQPASKGLVVDGNDPANRISFDSGVVPVAIPVGANLRVRWSADTERQTAGWVFGLDNVVMSLMSGIVEGDVNGDGFVDVADLDALTAAVASGTNDSQFDVDGNRNVDADDRTYWIRDIKGTIFGDVNFDRIVDSTDLNAVGLNWQSTTATSWLQGDFNGDGNVDSTDLNDVGLNWQKIVAAQASTAPVPEPSGFVPLTLGLVCLGIRPRMRTSPQKLLLGFNNSSDGRRF